MADNTDASVFELLCGGSNYYSPYTDYCYRGMTMPCNEVICSSSSTDFRRKACKLFCINGTECDNEELLKFQILSMVLLAILVIIGMCTSFYCIRRCWCRRQTRHPVLNDAEEQTSPMTPFMTSENKKMDSSNSDHDSAVSSMESQPPSSAGPSMTGIAPQNNYADPTVDRSLRTKLIITGTTDDVRAEQTTNP